MNQQSLCGLAGVWRDYQSRPMSAFVVNSCGPVDAKQIGGAHDHLIDSTTSSGGSGA